VVDAASLAVVGTPFGPRISNEGQGSHFNTSRQLFTNCPMK
jgi:hypothetical protein